METPTTFVCDTCKQEKPVRTSGGTGYATVKTDDPNVRKYKCYACCADSDRAEMMAVGNSKALPLYLTSSTKDYPGDWEVTNWPGSLRFKVTGMYTTRHNWGSKKTHVWFNGPDGHVWYGYQIGDNNEVCHCRRTKAHVANYPKV